MRIKITIIIITGFIIGLTAIILITSEDISMEGTLIFTQVSTDRTIVDYRTGGTWRYPSQARIVAADPEKPEETLKVLTGEFYSARSPEISYDGKRLLFTGQRKKGEPWQIWEMRLDNLRNRQITSCLEGCTDPAYLPDDRIAYSSLVTDQTAGTGHTLYTCTLTGTDIKRITFHPNSDFASTVLQDGRLLIISRKLYPDTDSPSLLVLRPDGTKSELFYKNRNGDRLSSRGWETGDGEIIFVEANENNLFDGRIVSISQKRPLHLRKVLTSGIKGAFLSAFPLSSGKLIVTHRPSGSDSYALYEFEQEEKQLGQRIYSDPNYHITEAVMVTERPQPKILPSVVNDQKTIGWLLCLNADLSDIPATEKSKKVQISGVQKVWGDVPLEEDGSFFIEVPADTPLRFRTVNEKGEVVRGPSAWIWVRPNERRGCVGCHEDRELAPENQVPLAINKPPISISEPTTHHFAEKNTRKK